MIQKCISHFYLKHIFFLDTKNVGEHLFVLCRNIKYPENCALKGLKLCQLNTKIETKKLSKSALRWCLMFFLRVSQISIIPGVGGLLKKQCHKN